MDSGTIFNYPALPGYQNFKKTPKYLIFFFSIQLKHSFKISFKFNYWKQCNLKLKSQIKLYKMKIIYFFTFKVTAYFSTTIFLQFQNQVNSPFSEKFICNLSKSKKKGKKIIQTHIVVIYNENMLIVLHKFLVNYRRILNLSI